MKLYLLHSLFFVARLANGFSFPVVVVVVVVARTRPNTDLNSVMFLTKNRERIHSSYFALGMKPQSENTFSGTSQLWFKDLSTVEESIDEYYNNWIEKWVEENHLFKSVAMHFPKMDSGKNMAYDSLKKDGGKNIHQQRIETDNAMPGSKITHFIKSSRESLLSDIEKISYKSPDIIHEMDDSTYHSFPSSIEYNVNEDNINNNKEVKNNEPTNAPYNRVSQHFQKVSPDLNHLSVSIASTIETPEQWREFCQNTGGLETILSCIHDTVEEIKGRSVVPMNDFEPLLYPDDVDGFRTACCACRVLRDLCAKDTLWASAITDEIIQLNKRNGTTVVSDLVFLLRHTNEAERIYSKKAWRIRRLMKKHGYYTSNLKSRKERRDSRRRCRLYISQLLLVMSLASDDAIAVFRNTTGLVETVRSLSSYTTQEKIRRKWMKYPIEKLKRFVNKRFGKNGKGKEPSQTAFLAAAAMKSGILGDIQGTSNKILAALGHNFFIPKTPGQRGLRILSLDGGGTRGIASIAIMKSIVDSLGGTEICDSFDLIAGTSTGAIIAFLIGLRRESNRQAKKRYDELIEKIFVKNSLAASMMLFTTASYSEVPFTQIMMDILGENSMIDSRADPRVPLVFCVSAKMTSTTSKLCLFRNYNYSGGEKKDTFVISPKDARHKLGFISSKEDEKKHFQEESNTEKVASRHEGSFRVLQRAALRATTAAPTVFKPVLLGKDMFSDGGIVASNPAAVAIHEARTIYPDIPIECVVSLGTGEFISEKVSPSFGWDGIVSQIVNSATDTAKTHWVLQDILGQGTTTNPSSFSDTKYFRFDPIIGKPSDFPIDATDPIRLEKLSKIASDYMEQPEQQEKLEEMTNILRGKLF